MVRVAAAADLKFALDEVLQAFARESGCLWAACDITDEGSVTALADTAAFCEAYGFAMEDSANAIVVIGKASMNSISFGYS